MSARQGQHRNSRDDFAPQNAAEWRQTIALGVDVGSVDVGNPSTQLAQTADDLRRVFDIAAVGDQEIDPI
jgi:hypothetical protein